MDKANVYPPAAVVKADDITAGIQEGRNSGAWTVGVYATGAHRYETLLEVGGFSRPFGAVPARIVYNQIQPRLMRGELPGEMCA